MAFFDSLELFLSEVNFWLFDITISNQFCHSNMFRYVVYDLLEGPFSCSCHYTSPCGQKWPISNFDFKNKTWLAPCLCNLKQTYISTFSAKRNPSSQQKPTELSLSQILIFFHSGKFCQKTSRTRPGLGCSIIHHPCWADSNPHTPTVRPVYTTATSSFTHGRLGWKQNQALLSKISSSIHHWEAGWATVLSQHHQIPTVSPFSSRTSKISTSLFC